MPERLVQDTELVLLATHKYHNDPEFHNLVDKTVVLFLAQALDDEKRKLFSDILIPILRMAMALVLVVDLRDRGEL